MASTSVSTPGRSVRRRLAGCSAAGALLLAGAAHADTIHSTFGPGDGYGNGGFYTAFDFGSVGGSIEDYDLANKFSTGSNAYRFDSARLGLIKTLGTTGDDFTLWLMADAGGTPGAILETIAYTAALGGLGTTVDVAASGTVLLAANTSYWIGIGSTFPDSVSWLQNSIGATGPASMAYAHNGGAWQFLNTPLAFAVNGTLVAAPAVPEPGSLALVALAIAAAVAVSRRPRATR